MSTAIARSTTTQNDEAGHRAEALEMLFSMLVKSLATREPEAVERFVRGMKNATAMPQRVRYQGELLQDETWAHVARIVDDLDDYLSKRKA